MFQLPASSVAGEPSAATVVLFASVEPADLALLRPSTFEGVTEEPPETLERQSESGLSVDRYCL